MEFDRKLNILLVLQTLKKYTNENCYLSQTAITEKVNQLYDTNLDRKTVRDHLSVLQYISDAALFNNKNNPLPFVIKKNKAGSYALTTGQLEVYEVNFLIDAILSSKFLCANDAVQLVDKITNFLSDDQKKIYRNVKRVYSIEQFNRTSSVETLSTVEAVYNAIANDTQISFLYQTYDLNGNLCSRDSGTYINVNPYKVIVKKGDYYVLGNVSGTDNITTFRVDYMEDTYELDDKRRPVTDLPGYENGFKVTKYINEHIYFTDGDVVDAKIMLLNPNAIRYVFDWFGKKAKVENTSSGLVASVRCAEDALYYWCMQYAEHIKVIKPQSLIKRMFNTACSIQLNVLNEQAKIKEKKLNLSDIYDNFVLISFTEPYRYNELRVNDLWNAILDINPNEVSYLHKVQYRNVGKLPNSDVEVNKLVVGRYDLTHLLLLTKVIIETAIENNVETFFDGKETHDVNYYKNKFFKSRIRISDDNQQTPEGHNIELCVNSIMELFKNDDQKDIVNIVEFFKRCVSSYYEQGGNLELLFIKATYAFGFTFQDAETSNEINHVRSQAGLVNEDISFRKRNNYEKIVKTGN